MDPLSQLGDVFRNLRRSRRLSQRELAERAGVPPSTLAAIESGRRQGSLGTVAQLLRACGYDLAILTDDGYRLDDVTWVGFRDRSRRWFPAHRPQWQVIILGDWWGDGEVSPRVRPRPAQSWGLLPPPRFRPLLDIAERMAREAGPEQGAEGAQKGIV